MRLKNKLACALIIAGIAAISVSNLRDLANVPTSADTLKTVVNQSKMQKTKQYFYHDLNAEIMIRSAEVISQNQLTNRLRARNITSIDLDDINYTYNNDSKTATVITVDIKNKNDANSVILHNSDFAIRDTKDNVYFAKTPDRQNSYTVIPQNTYNSALELYFDVPDDAVIKDIIIKNPIFNNTDILPYNFDASSFDAMQKEKIYGNQVLKIASQSAIYTISIIYICNFLQKKKKEKKVAKKCLI